MNKNMLILVSLSVLGCVVMQTNAASSLSSVLQSHQITNVQSMVFSGSVNPTVLQSSGQNMTTNDWLSSEMSLPTNIDFKSGVCFTFTNFSLMCNGLSCINYDCTIYDNSGVSLIQPTNLNATDSNGGGAAMVYSISVWLKSLKQKTNTLISFNNGNVVPNSAIFAVNVTWPVSQVINALPPTNTALGTYFASNGLSQVVGASLVKAAIENDLSIIVLTSSSSTVPQPTVGIYTLTGSSSFTNDVANIQNGIYVAVSSWASGASYFIADDQGNQLGTGALTAFGTVTGTILGALVCGSGTNSALVPAVAGAIPQVMLLQYPTPRPYVAASTEKRTKHKEKKHLEKKIKKLNHLITKNQTAQSTYATNAISGGVLLNQVVTEDIKFINKELTKLQNKLNEA